MNELKGNGRFGLVCVLLMLLAGCASTQEIMETDADPLEPYNRVMFTINDKIDKAVLKPVAQGYQFITPDFLRNRVTDFFGNLGDVVTLANALLQFKLEQAASDTSRIVYNTTFGLGGLFDVATPMGLPEHDEDFGQTLGYWGVGEGYYLVLPLLGPSTTRDVWGVPVDGFYLDPVSRIPSTATRLELRGVDLVNMRANFLRTERAFADAQVDPYSFQRQTYLQRRRDLVYDGNPPKLDLDFESPP